MQAWFATYMLIPSASGVEPYGLWLGPEYKTRAEHFRTSVIPFSSIPAARGVTFTTYEWSSLGWTRIGSFTK